jgi:hypothetical protein
MKKNKFPKGWDEERVRRVLAHYEKQTEEEAVAEDEATFEDTTQTLMEVPWALVPTIRELISQNSKHALAEPAAPSDGQERAAPERQLVEVVEKLRASRRIKGSRV